MAHLIPFVWLSDYWFAITIRYCLPHRLPFCYANYFGDGRGGNLKLKISYFIEFFSKLCVKRTTILCSNPLFLFFFIIIGTSQISSLYYSAGFPLTYFYLSRPFSETLYLLHWSLKIISISVTISRLKRVPQYFKGFLSYVMYGKYYNYCPLFLCSSAIAWHLSTFRVNRVMAILLNTNHSHR